MSPLTRLYRHSRSFRLLCYFLMLPAYLIVYLLADNSWAKYTEFGTVTVLVLYLAFAAGAWWYSEDRDHRQLASAAPADGTASPHDNGN
jgi:uncharacterized membrane protein